MRLPSPATGMAALALFLSLGGVSYAVTQLDDNSVRSRHVAANALTPADLAPTADPTKASFAFLKSDFSLPTAGPPNVVLKVPVEAGRYAIQAAVDVEMPPGSDSELYCKLTDGGGAEARVLDDAWDMRRLPNVVPASPQRFGMHLSGVTNGPTGAGNFELRCLSNSPNTVIYDARITATLVRGLQITGG